MAASGAEIDALKAVFNSANWRSFFPRWDFFDGPGADIHVEVRSPDDSRNRDWQEPWRYPKSPRGLRQFFLNPEDTAALWWDSARIKYHRCFSEGGDQEVDFDDPIRSFWKDQGRAWAQSRQCQSWQIRLRTQDEILELSPIWNLTDV